MVQNTSNATNTQSASAANNNSSVQSTSTNFNATVTAAQTEAFNKADQNHDNSISKDEFGNVAGRCSLDKKFAQADTDGNGSLSMEEFTKAMEARANKSADKKCGGGNCGSGKAGEAEKSEGAAAAGGAGNEDEEMIKKLMALGLSKEEATALTKAMKSDPALKAKIEGMLASGDKEGVKAEARKATQAESKDNSTGTSAQSQYQPPIDNAMQAAA